MSTNVYTTDGDWINTPVPYEIIKDQLLTERGDYIDVQESVEEVRKMLQYSEDGCFIAFTLENGEPTYIARDHVISFTKF